MISWTERAKAAISQTGENGTVKTDETFASRILAVSSVPSLVNSGIPERLSSVLAVPSSAVLEKLDSAMTLIVNPERWFWPHSSAMKDVEIDRFEGRLQKFTDKGMPRAVGEILAIKLELRDREQDDRRACLECTHLAGHGAGSWRCGIWQAAGVAIRSNDAQLPDDLVVQLQRCNGFTVHLSTR